MSGSEGLSIALDFAPPTFLPGHPVAGRLIVNSRSGVKTKGLSITLHGEVHVSWSEQHKVRKSWRSYRTSIGGTRRSYDSYEYRTYWYTAHETIFSFPQPLLSGNYEIPAGENSYPFSFQLPQNIPSSAWCTHGHLEYSLNACLERSWAIDWTTQMVIPVLALMDLRPFPQLSQPREFFTEQSSGCCCCTSAPVKLWCGLDKTGFYPGEVIRFRVRVENQSDKNIQSLGAQLNQNFTLRAEGHQNWATNTVASINRGLGLPTPASGEDFWQGELVVPKCPPTGLGAHGRARQLMDMYYTLNIIADINGCCSFNPNCSCDVTIGSYPPEASKVPSMRRF